MRIKVLRPFWDGKTPPSSLPRGKIVELADGLARQAIAAGKAELATAETKEEIVPFPEPKTTPNTTRLQPGKPTRPVGKEGVKE